MMQSEQHAAMMGTTAEPAQTVSGLIGRACDQLNTIEQLAEGLRGRITGEPPSIEAPNLTSVDSGSGVRGDLGSILRRLEIVAAQLGQLDNAV